MRWYAVRPRHGAAFLGVSVSRLHAVAPLSWIGSLPFGNVGPQFAQLAAAGGRLAVTGVAATVGVVGLAAGERAVASTRQTHPSAIHGGVAHASPDAATTPSGTGGGGSAGRPGSSESHGSAARPGHRGGSGASASGSEPGKTTTSAGGTTGGGPTGSADAGGEPNGGTSSGDGANGVGSGGGGVGTTTTVVSGAVPPVPTTTIGPAPTGSTTTTTTTMAPPPPLTAPSGLTVTSGCQALILVPEATLKWTASPTARVTGYVVLRSSTKTGVYNPVGSVSGRTTVAYTDTTVSGLSSTYWFEVEAVAGGSSAASGPVSTTTPPLCL